MVPLILEIIRWVINLHGVKQKIFHSIYPLIIYLTHSIIPVFNGFIVELVIICVYVCLLCQDTQINEFHVCSLFVCEVVRFCGMYGLSPVCVLCLFYKTFYWLPATFQLFFCRQFSLIFVVVIVVVVVVFIFAIDLGKRLVGRHMIRY